MEDPCSCLAFKILDVKRCAKGPHWDGISSRLSWHSLESISEVRFGTSEIKEKVFLPSDKHINDLYSIFEVLHAN
jgi:hypothetical protein